MSLIDVDSMENDIKTTFISPRISSDYVLLLYPNEHYISPNYGHLFVLQVGPALFMRCDNLRILD